MNLKAAKSAIPNDGTLALQLTLNQRVQGSSPCAPTIKSNTAGTFLSRGQLGLPRPRDKFKTDHRRGVAAPSDCHPVVGRLHLAIPALLDGDAVLTIDPTPAPIENGAPCLGHVAPPPEHRRAYARYKIMLARTSPLPRRRRPYRNSAPRQNCAQSRASFRRPDDSFGGRSSEKWPPRRKACEGADSAGKGRQTA